jgi:hypothetical protein
MKTKKKGHDHLKEKDTAIKTKRPNGHLKK